MANQKHLDILLSGVDNWNAWKKQRPQITPDFQNADLQGLKIVDMSPVQMLLHAGLIPEKSIHSIDLRGALLMNANFSGCNLPFADFRGAQLMDAKFEGTQLFNADFRNTTIIHNKFTNADLRGAKFQKSTLHDVDLSNAKLHYTNFDNANIRDIKYTRWGKYRFIQLRNCFGNHRFRRFAMDQDFIEEFRGRKFDMRPWRWNWNPFTWNWRFWRKTWWADKGPLRFWTVYLPWLILCDCGRSAFLWLFWCICAAIGFAYTYENMGPEAFHLANGLKWSFDTLLYYSTVTITTLGFGDVTPITPEAKHWVMAEVILGYILLGGLISIMATKLTRRSG